MPLRIYVSPMIGQYGLDVPDTDLPRPLIADYLNANGISWTCFDLRVAEEQKQPVVTGKCLVVCDVSPPQGNQLVALGATWIEIRKTTKADIVALLGLEGTEDPYDDTDLQSMRQWFRGVHKKRVDRWRGR